MRKILIILALLIGASCCSAQIQTITRPGKGHTGKTSGSNGVSKSKSKPQSKPTNKDSEKTLSFTVNGVTFEMIRVDGGSFQMGSNDGYDSEKPVHSKSVVTFYIGKTEVTQALWQAVMGENPSDFVGENMPVENVSWYDCQEFVDRLSRLIGREFRLPTEAEWEYAARGGNKSRGYTYSGSNELNRIGWYWENCEGTHPVGQKLDNELGIYDMSGNVWEWCSDNYSDSYISPRDSSLCVKRGGSWYNSAYICRVTDRGFSWPGNRSLSLGLRLAL